MNLRAIRWPGSENDGESALSGFERYGGVVHRVSSLLIEPKSEQGTAVSPERLAENVDHARDQEKP